MVECYEQTILFGSTKDQAMVNTVERLSASRDTGDSGKLQRTEAGCQGRDHVPMKLNKAHVTSNGSGPLKTGNGGRGKGGT